MALSGQRRKRVLARLIEAQQGACCYCRRGFLAVGDRIATIEHKKPKMAGGTNQLSNLAAACLHCNRHRGRQMVRSRRRALARQAAIDVTAASQPRLALPNPTA